MKPSGLSLVSVCGLSTLLVAATLGGCTTMGGGQDVKTPDQLIEEQEQLAVEEEKKKKARGDDDSFSSEETDAEKKRQFDKKQAKMELQRATRSAESCPGVVAEQETKDKPRGETRVSITFQEDGTVRQVSIPSPFDGTPVGECAMKAYKSVIVPPYEGGDQIVDWELSLKDAPKEKEEAKKKK